MWTDDMTKKLVLAWFNGRYALANNGEDAFYVGIGRKKFLQQLNAFLGSAGLPEWTIRTPMYNEWFIPQVMKVAKEDDDSRSWKLRQRTSLTAYKNLLKRLYHAA